MARGIPNDADSPERQFGPYRLTQQIATGGMAEIHLAKTRGIEGFEKYVALKMIHPNFSSDDHFVQMLIDEAKISVQLQHGNIAHVFDLGRVGNTYYIAMEFVDGHDLFKILRKSSEQDRYMPIESACFIAKEVCAGLDYAHHKRDAAGRPMGIVHRDISPQNVLISHSGEVKIVDFGIAKATMRVKQTAVGVIKGKYYYMSPEQAWGDSVDHRTDIFSAGILLYEMLTGQMLYLEEDMNKLLDMVRKADIPPPSTKRPDIPRELDRIVMRALAKKPDQRWQAASDFGTAIERFLHGFAPDYRAQRLSAFVRDIIPVPIEPVAPRPEVANVDTDRVTKGLVRQSIMSRSEFTDENSVIFRLNPKAGSVERVSDSRLRTPPTLPSRHAPTADRQTKLRPSPRQSIDETRAAKTFVGEDPTFGSMDAALRRDNASETLEPIEPIDEEPTQIDAPAGFNWGEPAPTGKPPPPPPPARPPSIVGVPTVPTEPAVAPLSVRPTPAMQRLSRRTPGAGVPVAARPDESGRAASTLPLSAPAEETSPPSAASVWPPLGSTWSEDDGPRIKIAWRLFGRRQLLFLAATLFTAILLGALGVAFFSNEPELRDTATVEVISFPAGAHLNVDGRDVGLTPARIDRVPLGRSLTLRVELAHYEPWQRTEPVPEPRDVKVVASLKPILGMLRVDSTPVGCEVFFNNRSLGLTPLTRNDMDPFVDGMVEVRKQGFKPVRESLRWKGQREASISVTLGPGAN